MLERLAEAVGLASSDLDFVELGEGARMRSAWPVSDLACASIGTATLAMARLVASAAGGMSRVRVDRTLASRWFAHSIEPTGWTLPPVWEALAGDYRGRDGWIRLHTNAMNHRCAALRVLGLERAAGVDRSQVAAAVAGWDVEPLETGVVAAGGCAAMLRSSAQWASHPQGKAVQSEPLVAFDRFRDHAAPDRRPSDSARPLAGVRVLDLTRILAGPVATRYLAGYGADVLRIDPPGWDEPSLAPEVTLGKRCARLDLREGRDRSVFEGLLSQADVLVHGYRADALEQLGFGPVRRRELNPALIDVALDAYGWTGPWRGRRGFDSLVQMSSGIAAAGMAWKGSDRPVSLPVQALDHATGYLLAATVGAALTRRLEEAQACAARVSLARVAALLMAAPADPAPAVAPFPTAGAADFMPTSESTSWGPARRLRPPYAIDGIEVSWARASHRLGEDEPRWADASSLSDRRLAPSIPNPPGPGEF